MMIDAVAHSEATEIAHRHHVAEIEILTATATLEPLHPPRSPNPNPAVETPPNLLFDHLLRLLLVAAKR